MIEFINDLFENCHEDAVLTVIDTILFLVKTVTIKKYHQVQTESRRPFSPITQKTLQEKENLENQDTNRCNQEVDEEVKKFVASSVFSKREKLDMIKNPYIPIAIGIVAK